MNILYIVPGGVDPSGTVRVIPALLALIKRTASRHNLTVAALRQFEAYREYELLGAHVINLGDAFPSVPGINFIRKFLRLLLALKRNGFKADLVHTFWFGETSSLGVGLSRLRQCPVVCSLCGGELVGFQDIAYGGLLDRRMRVHNWLAMRSAYSVTAGSGTSQALVKKNRQDAVLIPLLPEFKQVQKLPANSGYKGNDPKHPKRLLTVSTINQVKEPRTLLNALHLASKKIPDIRLDWVGEDTMHREIQKLADKLGMTRHIRFHGFKTQSQLSAYYGEADVYVQASRYECQGVSVCEAAAAGLALVGTDTGILKDLAPDAAVSVPASDHQKLAEAIVEVMQNDALRENLQRNAATWALENTADRTAEDFENLYLDLTDHSNGLRRGTLP